MFGTTPAARSLLGLLCSAMLSCAGCHGNPPPSDPPPGGDDDVSAGDDDTTASDDDVTGDDDQADDDSTGDDDSSSSGACDGLGADLRVPQDQPTIQGALNAAVPGDRICVEPGIYTGQVDYLGKAVELFGAHGAAETILSGGGSGPVVTFAGGEGPDSVLRGFTVADGVADKGGGIFVQWSSATLEDLVVRDCEASNRGGGIAVDGGSVDLRRSRIESCLSVHYGGGLAALDSSVSLTGVWFVANTAYSSGGGMLVTESFFKGENVMLWGSSAGHEGGGVNADDSTLELSHVVFAGNTADSCGGGLMATTTAVTGTNLVFAGNVCGGTGGGIKTNDSNGQATLELRNVTLVGNAADAPAGAIDGDGVGGKRLESAVVAHNSTGYMCGGLRGSPFILRYSDVWDNVEELENCVGWSPQPGNLVGNLTAEPMFADTTGADPASWNLHLQTASELVDAGDAFFLDPDGTISDMGAFGGPGADGWDLDSDGYPSWWQPGPYDPATFPAQGWDCDDTDPAVYPGSGC